MRNTVIAIILAAFLVAPVEAYVPSFPQTVPVNSSVLNSIESFMNESPRYNVSPSGRIFDMAVTGVRGGGTSGKPLGLYAGIQRDVIFRSDYPKVPPALMAAFALDLHNFVLMQGGGWSAFQNGGTAHVRYEKQAQFAEFWWRTHDAKFKGTAPLFRGWWVHDAILDATNVYERWQARMDKDNSSARLMYIDGELSQLLEMR